MYLEDFAQISVALVMIDRTDSEGELVIRLTIAGTEYQLSYGVAMGLHDALCMGLSTMDKLADIQKEAKGGTNQPTPIRQKSHKHLN